MGGVMGMEEGRIKQFSPHAFTTLDRFPEDVSLLEFIGICLSLLEFNVALRPQKQEVY